MIIKITEEIHLKITDNLGKMDLLTPNGVYQIPSSPDTFNQIASTLNEYLIKRGYFTEALETDDLKEGIWFFDHLNELSMGETPTKDQIIKAVKQNWNNHPFLNFNDAEAKSKYSTLDYIYEQFEENTGFIYFNQLCHLKRHYDVDRGFYFVPEKNIQLTKVEYKKEETNE